MQIVAPIHKKKCVVSLEYTRSQNWVHPHKDCCIDALNFDPCWTLNWPQKNNSWPMRGLGSDHVTDVGQCRRLADGRSSSNNIARGRAFSKQTSQILDWIDLRPIQWEANINFKTIRVKIFLTMFSLSLQRSFVISLALNQCGLRIKYTSSWYFGQ